jgi:hypothetical protein
MKSFNNWTDEVINSLDNIERAKPSQEFLARMESKMTTYYATSKQLKGTSLLLIAASFAILIAANLTIVSINTSENTQQTAELPSSTYELIPNKYLFND